MIPEADYISLCEDPPTVSTDLDMDDSDQESLRPSQSSRSPALDYWFGKKWFQCFIWQHLMSLDRADDSIQAMDCMCDAIIQDYPYMVAMKSICASRYSNVDTATVLTGRANHELFFITVGSIMSRGSDEEQEALLQNLRQYHHSGGNAFGSVRGLRQTARRTVNPTEGAIRSASPLEVVEQTDLDLPRYTSRLKEKGDRLGVVVNYRYEEISSVPPSFRCMLAFRDYVFVGIGGSKQRARHEASKDGCRTLGINIR